MKKRILCAVVLLLALLAGCGKAGSGSDAEYVKGKGTLVVGITVFEPMDYQDENGKWIGFDAELAQAFAESLGVTAEFQIIDWDSKVFELEGKTIDVVWNGMTLTEDVLAAMACSDAYCSNAQIVVLPKEKGAEYPTVKSLNGLTFAVEAGSAGKAAAEAQGLQYIEVEDQATALLEVNAGTADAAIIDSLMAGAMTGEGTSYSNLVCTLRLTSEEYGVGFRKGSDLPALLNAFLSEQRESGALDALAQRYGVQEAMLEE